MAEQSNQKIELHDLTQIGICNHQVSGFSDSCSVVSELPDLRNWFSSYVYESPELDSDDFGVSFSVIEGEYEERGLYAKDAKTKGEEELPDFKTIRNNDHAAQEIYASRPVVGNNCDQHKELEGDISILASVIKVPDYTDSVSFTSEPPDIRNWFSSYVYDSPEIDSMEVGVLVSRGTDRYSSKEVATPSKNREDSTIGKEIASNGFITCKKSGRQKTNENGSIVKDIEGLEQNHSLHAERTPEQGSEEVALKCHDNGQAKVAAAPTVKNEGSTYLLEAQPTRENDFLPFDSHGSSVVKLRSKEKLFDSGKSTEMDLEAKAKTGNFNCQNNSEWILPLHRFVGGHCQISKRENESSISRENDCLPFGSRGSSAIKLRSEEKLHDGGVSMEKDLEAKAKIGGINGQNNPDWILPIPRFVGGHSQSRNRENRSGMSRENDYLPFGSHGSSIMKRMSKEKLLDGGESMEKDSEAKANIGRINGQNNSDWSLPTCSSVNREDKSSLPRKNAFTSTRKSTSARINDENSLKGFKCMNEVTKVKSVSAVDEKMKGTTKKALKESTNLQHSNMLEIAGKWRCPQKTKPNKGPPLKQLRLEGWIHRI